MVFSSTIFLFGFLPVLIILYFITPRVLKNSLLLAASLLFYAWGEGVYLLIMLASIGLSYATGLFIAKSSKPKVWLVVGVICNLALLISFKYAIFLSDNLNLIFTTLGFNEVNLAPIHLPLGISFFTFQAISYLADVYRREIRPQENILNLGLYISFFPQLIAGPIVRYKTIVNDIMRRQESLPLFVQGLERFIYGLAKKMLIANPLGLVVDTIFGLPASELPVYVAWFGILCYALQIYFDFSAYSDMAIGLGRMFGFRFLENFNYPYSAKSLQEFWRRWHISLSTWFRDYLYIPLGGNRLSPLRTYINLFSVFLLCGLWHGASWNFLIWGALHGAILTIERSGFGSLLNLVWSPLRHIYLIFIVLITWVFFRADTLDVALAYLSAMFSLNFSGVPFEFIDTITVESISALLIGLALVTPIYRRIKLGVNTGWESLKTNYSIHLTTSALLLSLLSLSIVKLASTTHNPFIYFRF